MKGATSEKILRLEDVYDSHQCPSQILFFFTPLHHRAGEKKKPTTLPRDGRQTYPQLFVTIRSTMTSDKADINQHLLPRRINYPSLHAYSPSLAMNMQWPRMSHIHVADAQQRVNITYPSLTGHREK